MGAISKAPFIRFFLNVISRKDDHSNVEIGATLEITTIFPCTIACRICPQEKCKSAYTGRHRLTFNEFRTVLEKIPKHVRLDFSGFSEPFLNKESSLMMAHAFRSGYNVALFTTLVGFSQSHLENLKGVHFSVCTIHIPDDTNFRVADENKWLDTYRLFAQHIPYDNAIYHMGKISPRLKREVARICRPQILTRANCVDSEIVKPLARHKGAIRCSISGNLFHQNLMMPNGDIYLCCMDWSLQHKLGNLFEQEYKALHTSDEHHKICRSVNDPSLESICRYCERSVRNP